jgi:hypothetical protein
MWCSGLANTRRSGPPHVDAARLHHRLVVRREAQPAGGEGGLQIAVREQHGQNLPIGLVESAPVPLRA